MWSQTIQFCNTTRNVTLRQLYVPFTEQTSESSLPLLDIIFGMIFPFQSAQGMLRNFLRIPFSVIITYPSINTAD